MGGVLIGCIIGGSLVAVTIVISAIIEANSDYRLIAGMLFIYFLLGLG